MRAASCLVQRHEAEMNSMHLVRGRRVTNEFASFDGPVRSLVRLGNAKSLVALN